MTLNVKQIIKEEYVEYMLEQYITEAKPKKVTKQMWAKMSEYQKMDALLTVIKDPDKAEKFLDKKWNQLPSGFERDMMSESVNEAQLQDLPIKSLLGLGAKATVNMGEKKLYALSEAFENWLIDNDDNTYEGITAHLDMAIELIQEKESKSAIRHINKFNKECGKALKGLK